MNAELREAVDVLTDHIADLNRCIGVFHAYPALKPVADEFEKATKELAPVVRALRDQEAEIARLSEINVKLCANFNAQNIHGARLDDRVRASESRAEQAEALLREVHAHGYDSKIHARITAHLGGEQ